MPIADWLREYRDYNWQDVERPTSSDAPTGWEEEELLAPADRPRDTTPRWKQRAAQVGYGPPRQF